MASPLLEDYLFLVAQIVARLKAQLPELDVLPIEAMAQATERSVRTSTAFVLWEGDRFSDQAGDGRSTAVVQSFTVVLAVRNADQVDKDARNLHAGPLLSRLHKAVAGWAPEGVYRNFRRANGPRRPNYGPNVGLYPLTFEINLVL
jgi:hypothetical protein